MSYLGRLAVIAVTVTVMCFVTHGQRSRTGRNGDLTIRQTALYTLDDIADEVRDVEDVKERVALIGETVILLSKSRPERCRQMLDSLFIEVMKKQESAAGDEEQVLEQETIVSEVIAIAASFDRKLAESYISRYAKLEKESNASFAKSPGRAGEMAAGLSLRLATELIDKDSSLAVSVAERSLGYGIKPDTLIFLTRLRRKDAALANNFALTALRSVEMREGNDVNELFLLYAYVFSTPQVPFISSEGPAYQQIPDYAGLVSDGAIDSRLIGIYLRTSVRLLLGTTRSQRMSLGQVVLGALGDYYFLKLIEPQVAGTLPMLVAQVAAREVFLVSSLNQAQRPSAAAVERLSNSQKDAGNSVVELDQLAQHAADISDVKKRDRVYFGAMMKAVEDKRYDLALAIVEKLSPEVRDVAKPFVKFGVAEKLVAGNQLDKAEQFARDDEDTGRRAYLLTLIARSMAKTEFKNWGRVTGILNEVEQISSKLDNREKAIALAGVASVYAVYDAARSSELLREVIKFADKVNGFTGKGKMTRSFEYDGLGLFYEMYSDDLSIVSAFEQQARYNFTETLADARAIKSRLFRLRATIAICRAVLT